MRGFNPITDLRPPDPFNEPAGQSTEAIERIRTRLVSTREKTAELVDVIKTKNISFKKDIDKIQELNRRLRKTIPRIPIMRGDAGTTSGDTIEEQFRRGFGLGFGGFARSRQKAPVKSAFPFLDLAIAGLLSARGLKGLGKTTDIGAFNNIKNFTRKNTKPIKIPEIFIPSGATKGGRRIINITDFVEDLTKKPNVLKPGSGNVIPFRRRPTFAPSKEVAKKRGKVFEGDASQRTVDVEAQVVSEQNIISRLTKIFDARRLKKFSKEKGFLQFSKRADELQKLTKVPFELRPYDTKLEVNRYVQQLQRAAQGKTNIKYPDFNSIENLFTSNRADLKVMLKQRKAQLNNLTPGTEDYKNMQSSIRLVERGIRRINKSFERYLNKVDSQIRQETRLERQNRNIIKRMLNKANKEVEDFLKLPKSQREQIIKNRKEGEDILDYINRGGDDYVPLDQLDFGTIKYNKNKSRVNAKPMNNDLAMLNTNTGFTRETVIITDSIG